MNGEAPMQHLTDEQFSDLMAGESPAESTRVHLLACERCRSEVESLQEGIASFNGLSMSWAHQQAPRRVPVPSRLALRLGGRPVWGLGLAATAAGFLVAFGMTLPYGHKGQERPAQAVTVSPTGDELAEDNRLMQSINNELRYDVQPAVPASELRKAVHHEHPGAGTVAN